MAITSPEPEDVLRRAAEQLRAEEQPGWVDISFAVLTRVWATTRHTWPVLLDLTGLPVHARQRPHDSIHLADQVIVSAIRQALESDARYSPANIDLFLDRDQCTGGRVDVIAAYGQQLTSLAHQIRVTTGRVLTELLGPSAPNEHAIEVHIRDVTATDPRL